MVLGAASFMSLMTIPAQATKVAEVGRNPASLPDSRDSIHPLQVNLSKLEDISWDCKSKNPNSVLSATHFRMKGKTACRGQAIKELKIKNLSNGFTATVFANEKGFLTDFIDLQVGANDVQLEYLDYKGKLTTTSWTVLRQ